MNKPETPSTGYNLDTEMDINSDIPNANALGEAVTDLLQAIELSRDVAPSPFTAARNKPLSSRHRSDATEFGGHRSWSHWLYTSRSADDVFVRSSWQGWEMLFPSTTVSASDQRVKHKNPQAHVPGSRGKRVVSVDQAGIFTRRSLMQYVLTQRSIHSISYLATPCQN